MILFLFKELDISDSLLKISVFNKVIYVNILSDLKRLSSVYNLVFSSSIIKKKSVYLPKFYLNNYKAVLMSLL
jgi:hypothetical protein